MSLYIEVDKITRVLLSDGWYEVHNESFTLDSYEFGYGDEILHGGGQSRVCATGFAFLTDTKIRIAGPLTALLAVEERMEHTA